MIIITIWNYGSMCRITTSDIRLRKKIDGACILDLQVLMAEMERIKIMVKEEIGSDTVFEIIEA